MGIKSFKKRNQKNNIKNFLVVAYLTLGSVFIYQTFNNSFWLIDNGNSGFVGEISYNFIYNFAPWVNNVYSISVLFLLTFVFFIISSDLNIKDITLKTSRAFLSIFKKKKDLTETYLDSQIEEKENFSFEKKPQQSFSFEKKDSQREKISKIKYQLPNINYLEKKLII